MNIEEKKKLAIEIISEDADLKTEILAQSALLRLGQLAESTNAGKIEIKTDATFNNKRYLCKMVCTIKEYRK